MILPDINLLIHAHNTDSPVHAKARDWLDGLLAGNIGVGFPWVVQLGFIRITTHASLLQNPWPVNEVMRRLESWQSLPHFHVAPPSARHFQLLK